MLWCVFLFTFRRTVQQLFIRTNIEILCTLHARERLLLCPDGWCSGICINLSLPFKKPYIHLLYFSGLLTRPDQMDQMSGQVGQVAESVRLNTHSYFGGHGLLCKHDLSRGTNYSSSVNWKGVWSCLSFCVYPCTRPTYIVHTHTHIHTYIYLCGVKCELQLGKCSLVF